MTVLIADNQRQKITAVVKLIQVKALICPGWQDYEDKGIMLSASKGRNPYTRSPIVAHPA